MRLVNFFVVLGCFFLAGCAGTGPNLTSVTEGIASGTTNEGVAVLRVGHATMCPYGGTFTVGKKVKTGYESVSSSTTAKTWLVKKPITQLVLSQGIYHVTALECIVGNRKLTVGKRTKSLFFGTGKEIYAKSFASFEVKPGEVVNLGYLKISSADGFMGILGSVDFKVEPISNEDMVQFAKNAPKLHAKMVNRPMKVAALDPKVLKLRCDFERKMSKDKPDLLSDKCKI